jgi:uncharacterized protein with GYD domain
LKSLYESGSFGEYAVERRISYAGDTEVPTYVVLGKYTEQGGRNISDAVTRLNAVEQRLQQVGGRMLSWHMTLGEYDLVTIIELPSDDEVLQLALEVAKMGNLSTTTLKAFSRDQVAAVISKLT